MREERGFYQVLDSNDRNDCVLTIFSKSAIMK